MKAKGNWTVETLFADRPEALKLCTLVRDYLLSLDDVQMDVTKTQVSFGVTTKFAWVWLPQLWTKNRPETSVTLTFDLDHRLKNRRIAQAVEPRPGRWTHHVVLGEASDFDDQVRGWLSQAHTLSRVRGMGKKA